MSSPIPTPQDVITAWNDSFPVGTPVRYWPGAIYGAGQVGVTRTPAWLLGEVPVVSIRGAASGIALTHVDPYPEAGAE